MSPTTVKSHLKAISARTQNVDDAHSYGALASSLAKDNCDRGLIQIISISAESCVGVPLPREDGGPPLARLIYQAGFENNAFMPPTDLLGLGPLQLTQSPELPGSARTDVLKQSGLRLTVTRTSSPDTDKDDTYVGAVVPFRDDIDLFKIRATFELPEWDSVAQKYGWAMVLFVRKGDYPARDERTTVTLQSALNTDGLFGKVNTPGGPAVDPANAAPEIPESIRAAIFDSGDRSGSTFTLELLVNRRNKVARAGFEPRARLWARWFPGRGGFLYRWMPYAKHRWFTHRLITPPLPGDPVGPIESAGFAIAITKEGLGTASATVTDFRIYTLSLFDILLAGWTGIFNRKGG